MDVFELDPSTGEVRSVLEAGATEGIAVDGEDLWIHGGASLVRVGRSGGPVLEKRPADTTVQDLALDEDDLLYLVNGSPDTVTRVAPTLQKNPLPIAVTRSDTGYAMAVWDHELWVVDTAQDDESVPMGTTVVRGRDRYTGRLLESAVLPEGWVTALAPID